MCVYHSDNMLIRYELSLLFMVVYNGCAKILILMMAIIILFQNRSQKYNISSTSLCNTRVLKLMTARWLTVNIFLSPGASRHLSYPPHGLTAAIFLGRTSETADFMN